MLRDLDGTRSRLARARRSYRVDGGANEPNKNLQEDNLGPACRTHGGRIVLISGATRGTDAFGASAFDRREPAAWTGGQSGVAPHFGRCGCDRQEGQLRS